MGCMSKRKYYKKEVLQEPTITTATKPTDPYQVPPTNFPRPTRPTNQQPTTNNQQPTTIRVDHLNLHQPDQPQPTPFVHLMRQPSCINPSASRFLRECDEQSARPLA